MRRYVVERVARCVVITLGALAGLSACSVREDSVLGASNLRASAAGAPAAGLRFGIGMPADDARLAQWNVDAGPGGDALPAGSGTVAQGEAVYARGCLRCHGVGGEGMAGPPAYPRLVGRDSAGEGFRFANDPTLVKTIGNYWPHAYTLFDYIKRSMPHDLPRTLRDDEVYAVTAYLLHANALMPKDATLDAKSLRAVKMPYEDRFVRDDRTGGPVVR